MLRSEFMYGGIPGVIDARDFFVSEPLIGQQPEQAKAGKVMDLNVPPLGRPQKKVLLTALKANPNVELTGVTHELDPGRAPNACHTRSLSVMRLIAKWEGNASAEMKRTLAEANDLFFYAGSEEGWMNRLSAKGAAKFPTFNVEEWADAAELVYKSYPLNSVSEIVVAPKGYAPNLQASTGYPSPSLSKGQDKGRIGAARAAIEASGSYEALAEIEGWKKAIFTLKAELHDVNKIREKARAYYCFPGPTSTWVGAFMFHFTHGCKTFADDPDCTNLVGTSFFRGGASKIWKSVQAVEETAACFYGDDGLIIIVMPSGRRYVFLPDVTAMDMNTPDGFKELWVQHVCKFWIGDEGDSLFNSGIDVYNTLLNDGEYILPYGIEAKLRNFSTTGLTSNTHYQGCVNALIWFKMLRPIVLEGIATAEAGNSAGQDYKVVSGITSALYVAMAKVGPKWKPGANPTKLRHKIEGFLGHNLEMTSEGVVLAYVPPLRVLASLMNDRLRPKKDATSIFVAYARGTALAVAGGYMHPSYFTLLKILYDECISYGQVAAMEHRKKLCEMGASAGLGLGDDEARLTGVFRLRGGTFEIAKPVTKELIVRLRTEESRTSLAALFEGVVMGLHDTQAASDAERGCSASSEALVPRPKGHDKSLVRFNKVKRVRSGKASSPEAGTPNVVASNSSVKRSKKQVKSGSKVGEIVSKRRSSRLTDKS